MNADDPRHGTSAGHSAGCRDDCCSLAKLRYDKARKYAALVGKPRTVPALGTLRRIRALQALGYSMPQIARVARLSDRTVQNPTFRGDSVYATTAEAISAAYDQLSMTVPEGGYAKRNRLLAQRNHWAPPLAWDDIDTDEAPTFAADASTDFDEAVVIRLLSGEHSIKSRPVDKAEALRRWVARGGSERGFCQMTGWKESRYAA